MAKDDGLKINVIGKGAGGSMCSRSVICEIPYDVYEFLTGQDSENTLGGVKVLTSFVQDALTNHNDLREMRETFAKLMPIHLAIPEGKAA